MTRQFLLELITKRHFLDLTYLAFVYWISWMVTIKLGFTILQVNIKLKNIIICALLGTLINWLCLK